MLDLTQSLMKFWKSLTVWIDQFADIIFLENFRLHVSPCFMSLTNYEGALISIFDSSRNNEIIREGLSVALMNWQAETDGFR